MKASLVKFLLTFFYTHDISVLLTCSFTPPALSTHLTCHPSDLPIPPVQVLLGQSVASVLQQKSAKKHASQCAPSYQTLRPNEAGSGKPFHAEPSHAEMSHHQSSEDAEMAQPLVPGQQRLLQREGDTLQWLILLGAGACSNNEHILRLGKGEAMWGKES